MSESVTLTLAERIGLVKKSIVEIVSIVEDCRSKTVGGIKTGLLLWETCVIPFLTYNAGSWLQMKKGNFNTLWKLENSFYNSLLAVRNCPSMAMYWDLGVLVMPLRILKEKLLLYHHISCLPQNSVARQVLDIQERLDYPSLRKEISHFLSKYEVFDVRKFSKKEWKCFVNKNIIQMNREYIIENSKHYKKIDYITMACEDFEIKGYFHDLNLEESRIKFRERSHCMTTCKTNYSNNYEYIKSMFECENCLDEIDNFELHWKTCRGLKHLRENKDLSDSDLVAYYREIISLRTTKNN